MKTLVLQVCVSLVRAVFALMALRAARSMHAWERPQRLSWLATGITFAVYAVIMLAQDVIGVRAYLGGADTPVYAFYMRFGPVVEHARTFMMFGFYGALVALAFLGGRSDRAWWTVFAASLVASGLAGAAAGYVEGSLTGRHFVNTAYLDILGFAVLGTTLFVSMYRNSMDRYLWSSIAIYGFTSIAGALYLTTTSWFMSGDWRPPSWQRPLVAVFMGMVMVGMAWHRWRLARRGQVVEGLMPALRTPRPMLG